MSKQCLVGLAHQTTQFVNGRLTESATASMKLCAAAPIQSPTQHDILGVSCWCHYCSHQLAQRKSMRVSLTIVLSSFRLEQPIPENSRSHIFIITHCLENFKGCSAPAPELSGSDDGIEVLVGERQLLGCISEHQLIADAADPHLSRWSTG